jgi:hypothetical protein
MDDINELPSKSRAGSESESVRLSEDFAVLPAETGEAIARLQLQAMEQAYEERLASGTVLFTQSKITSTPVELGHAAAELRCDGMRAAILGFAWRWPLVGGVISGACLVLGFSFGVAAIALIAAVPISCVLVVV